VNRLLKRHLLLERHSSRLPLREPDSVSSGGIDLLLESKEKINRGNVREKEERGKKK
jgi:hypothetical protein